MAVNQEPVILMVEVCSLAWIIVSGSFFFLLLHSDSQGINLDAKSLESAPRSEFVLFYTRTCDCDSLEKKKASSSYNRTLNPNPRICSLNLFTFQYFFIYTFFFAHLSNAELIAFYLFVIDNTCSFPYHFAD